MSNFMNNKHYLLMLKQITAGVPNARMDEFIALIEAALEGRVAPMQCVDANGAVVTALCVLLPRKENATSIEVDVVPVLAFLTEDHKLSPHPQSGCTVPEDTASAEKDTNECLQRLRKCGMW